MHKTSCEECRSNYEEDDREPPCDEKGNCPINAVDLLPENQEPLALWYQIKAFGSDLVFTLSDLTVTKIEAEELLQTMSTIEGIVNDFLNRQQEAEE